MNIIFAASILIITLFLPLKWSYKYIIPGVALIFIFWISIELYYVPEDKDAIYLYSILLKASAVSFFSFILMTFLAYMKEKMTKTSNRLNSEETK